MNIIIITLAKNSIFGLDIYKMEIYNINKMFSFYLMEKYDKIQGGYSSGNNT